MRENNPIPRLFVLLCAVLLPAGAMLHAQVPGGLGAFSNFGDAPVEITADGETRFEGGVAIAENNVQIHYGDLSIYTDYAEYNPDTRDVLLVGSIRIYTPEGVFTGQRSVFNLESRQTRALEMAGQVFPLRFRAMNIHAPSLREFRVKRAVMTTDDSSEPSFYVRSRTVRIYPDDRVIFLNSVLYVKDVPVFWFPYLYANMDTAGFDILPGYDSRWGAYVLTSYGFPIGEGNDLIGRVRADYRTKRGFALGFDADINFGPSDRNTGKLELYHTWDQDPGLGFGGESEPEETDQENRYRVAYKQTFFVADDLYAKANISVLSDVDMLEDFFPAIYRIDPEPDNYIGLTKWSDFFTIDLLTRWQVNDFQQYTERLPEGTWEIKNHRIFGWPVFYSGQTGVGYLRRAFEDTSAFPDYESARFDTYHQFSTPALFFNWLSVVPRAGFRLTGYNRSGSFYVPDPNFPENQALAVESSPLNTPTPYLETGSGVARPIFNFNLESSFKLSRAYETVQARWAGLDGLRHIVQPYTNLSLVYNAGISPDNILQFDRVVPSTQLLPIDFPEFTAIDSIDSWAILRLGTRQRLQTRRVDSTHDWLTLDSFFDVNFENPYSDADVSNFFNIVTFSPVPWLNLAIRSQIPIVSEGFTEVDTRLYYTPVPQLSLGFGQAYIENNEYFANSTQTNFSAYWRINDHWAVSLYEQYAAPQNLFIYQNYMIHRDLSSWVASIGGQVRSNEGGPVEYGLLFMMTLKDAPQIAIPLAFDTGTDAAGPGASNF